MTPRPLIAALLLLAAPAAASILAAPAAAFETEARAAYVVDLTHDTVLMDKNADQPLPPASMSKLMTLYMLFEAVEDGRVDLDTRFPVSPEARSMGGSTMFLNERDRPTVEELIRGIVVQSGNDATVVVAEGLAGTEEAFAQLMNERAADIGLSDSNFVNASGWPHPDHRMSTKDLAILAERLIEDFPEEYAYFAEEEYDFDGRAPANSNNRNPLLGLGIGADGLKTGHTQEAGYGLVGSAEQAGRRIVFVITGIDTTSQRAQESERIVAWAFRQFVSRDVVEAGTRLATAPVWMGAQGSVGLVAPEGVELLLSATARDATQATVVYDAPLEAPIAEGQEIGHLVVERAELPPARIPLVAEHPVDRGGFVPRVTTAARVLIRDLAGDALGAL
jgi:D-alanyl-D-alanine carboxypeptidase (penicillin-binding protein 5/6)